MGDAPDIREMHERNRAAWNDGAVGYDEHIGDMDVLPGGGTTLKPVEIEHLGDLRPWCRRAIHLQCASGADTLSLVNLGAAEVVGVDISDVHIENARRKTAALGFPATWVRADILDTPHDLDGTADLVYTGKGALCWLHDLDGWAAVVARLLRPGGRFYLFEQHPLTWLFKETATEYERDLTWSYFRTEPDISRGWGEEYIGNRGRDPEDLPEKYARLWPVSTVITSLARAGLRLDAFWELPNLPYSFSLFPNMPPAEAAALPQSYAVAMTRPA